MGKTSIEWTDETWNPVRGCSKVSPGCKNCYAMRQAIRRAASGEAYEGLVRSTAHGPEWTGKLRVADQRTLERPLHWKRPRMVFVNSMSDLFHEDVGVDVIQGVFDVMERARDHVFQILTKRAKRMSEIVPHLRTAGGVKFADAPLTHVWLGVSVESRPYLSRIDQLRDTPAAIRFVSFEPLLEDLGTLDLHGIDWAIIGGESGPQARDCDVRWIRDAVSQCRFHSTAPFVKQLGARPVQAMPGCHLECRCGLHYGFHHRKGSDMNEWPEDLRVREFPQLKEVS